MNRLVLDEKIKEWLLEDINNGDVTTDSLIDEENISKGKFIAKEDGVIAGIKVMEKVFHFLDYSIKIDSLVNDGDIVKKGEHIAVIEGSTLNILKGERLALNLLQRISGIATVTRKYVNLLQGLNTRLVDTRKTSPGLRMLEKYAVKVGGGYNHRFNLSDGVLIKDNHITACGGITEALERIRENISHTMKVEIEVKNLEELQEALEAKAEIVLLDNMSIEMMKQAVHMAKNKAILEASGNITSMNIKEVAQTGVDIISVGAITHSVKALDISLRLD